MKGKDRYAGDAAWRQWFDVCCIDGCEEEHRKSLADEVASALGRAVESRKCQLSYERRYLLAYFDMHFKLGGSFDKPKPLKQYLLAKIPNARNGLRGVVLGSIMSGEVKTMSRKIKLVEDGTQTEWHTYPKDYIDKELAGRKVLIIGSSIDAEITENDSGGGAQEKSTGHDIDWLPVVEPNCGWTSVQPAETSIDIDKKWFYKNARELLGVLGSENRSENSVTLAAMVYARANKISPTRAVLQRILGVKQGGAAKKMHKMEEDVRRFCKNRDVRSDRAEFVKALLDVSTTVLARAGVLKELEEAR